MHAEKYLKLCAALRSRTQPMVASNCIKRHNLTAYSILSFSLKTNNRLSCPTWSYFERREEIVDKYSKFSPPRKSTPEMLAYLGRCWPTTTIFYDRTVSSIISGSVLQILPPLTKCASWVTPCQLHATFISRTSRRLLKTPLVRKHVNLAEDTTIPTNSPCNPRW